MILVTLSDDEMRRSAVDGFERQLEAVHMGLEPAAGLDPDNEPLHIGLHIFGDMRERAYAKGINRLFVSRINNFSGADFDERTQIRGRRLDWHELIVRPYDNPDHIYVLVNGRMPNFKIIGELLGLDCMNPSWLKTHGNRAPAHFVPHSALKPVGYYKER